MDAAARRVLRTTLARAIRHRDAVETIRADVLAERDAKGRPAYGFGFARNVTTTALRAGIVVDRAREALGKGK